MASLPGFLDTGITINQIGATVAAQPLPHLREPLLFLRWSDDGGHTWSNFHERGLGLTGNFQKLARWRALGQSRNRVYEVSYDDPVALRLIDSFLNGGEDYQPQQRLNDRLRQMA